MKRTQLLAAFALLLAIPLVGTAANSRPIKLQYQRGTVNFTLDATMTRGADGQPRDALPLTSNAWTSPARALKSGSGYTAQVGDLKLPIPTGKDPNAGLDISCKVALVKHGDKGPSGDTCNDWLHIGCVDVYDCSVTLSIGK